MPVDLCGAALWVALAAGAVQPPKAPITPPTAPATPNAAMPDMELIEFLGDFETETGQWPELNEILSTRAPTPKEETQR